MPIIEEPRAPLEIKDRIRPTLAEEQRAADDQDRARLRKQRSRHTLTLPLFRN